MQKKYANSIAEGTDRYGTALIYYARAHNSKKVKSVLDLLVSYSLVGSLAYPPSSDLDNNLRSLISSPKESLTQIAEVDSEAAELLQTHLSGYAALRQFYNVRDEEKHLKEGQKPSLRPLARKKAAAAALLAMINSAADNIHGGLYDEHRGAVVQVDGLLALLGEALVFVDRMLTLYSSHLLFPSRLTHFHRAQESFDRTANLFTSQSSRGSADRDFSRVRAV